MTPTIESGTPTVSVDSIKVISLNQLSVTFNFDCEINNISDDGILNVITSEN